MLPTLRRSYFTLIEMMIVLAVILFVAGSVGINVIKAVKQERFYSGVALIADKLQLAQDLMLLLGADVVVKLQKAPEKEGAIYCIIEIEQSVSDTLTRFLNRSSLIEGVSSFSFEESSYRFLSDNVQLKFMSSGTVMSKGMLLLFSQEKKLKEEILLTGNPRPITAGSDAKNLLNQLRENEYTNNERYPDRVLENYGFAEKGK
jgi:prepilin-type N-terminal cleavage/methylation domain-containing protein